MQRSTRAPCSYPEARRGVHGHVIANLWAVPLGYAENRDHLQLELVTLWMWCPNDLLKSEFLPSTSWRKIFVRRKESLQCGDRIHVLRGSWQKQRRVLIHHSWPAASFKVRQGVSSFCQPFFFLLTSALRSARTIWKLVAVMKNWIRKCK